MSMIKEEIAELRSRPSQTSGYDEAKRETVNCRSTSDTNS
jgi:hypothetical protein